jgi:hypothetical protein
MQLGFNTKVETEVRKMASQPVAEITFMEQLGEIGRRVEANAEG